MFRPFRRGNELIGGRSDRGNATVRGVEELGEVRELSEPDQVKSAGQKYERIEPEINAT